MQRIVWINKSNWLKPGPIVYMGLLNALAFAENDVKTDFFVGAGSASDTLKDFVGFYGLQPNPHLIVHRIIDQGARRRSVYTAALNKISEYSAEGDDVLALTRELGALWLLIKLKKRFPRLKVLYEAHDYYLTTKHLELKRFSFSAFRRKWSERILIPKTDGLICLTEHQRALFQQWFPNMAIIALPLGCLDVLEKPMFEQRRLLRRVAYIGHLHGYKGLELIFQLASHLKSANIELHCFGGHAAQVVTLRKRAELEGLASVLHFEPFIEPKTLHQLLDNDMSLGLVPLQDTFYSRYLTCPVKALDFMAHGLPVIASDLPSTREVLRETACYCDSQSEAEFANKIIGLLDNTEAYQAASLAGYARSKELRWAQRAQRILAFAGKL
jgi:glycosyltransferase involved in cell wall biosynthesis